MNRIEVYLDRDNRLSLDFYYNIDDNFPISIFKGEKCYSIISKLCESPILNIKEDVEMEEVNLNFKNCILNISECERVFSKRGTGPIKKSLDKYYELEKKKTFEVKKVTRKNKYTGQKIIASTLVLALLGSVIIKEQLNRNQKDKMPINDSNSYTEEIENTEENEIYVQDYNYVEPVNDSHASNSVQSLSFKTDSQEISNEINISIDYEDRSNTEKAIITKAYYGETIEKYAAMYGLDPVIVTSIATQERGIHAGEMDFGGATGLMQIQNSVWVGEKLSAYNYETGEYDVVTVNREDLSDVFCNIKYGCMIFQNCMDYMNNNVLAAIQCYNMGYGNMMDILNSYSLETGKTIEQILSDVSDYGWIEHRNIINVGDEKYLEHVLSWAGSNIKVQSVKNNINLNINNNVQKNMSFN